MPLIKNLIIHHSYSNWGNAIQIDYWHRNRKPTPFKMIGYHFIILNGYPSEGMERPFDFMDGTIEAGRPLNDDPLLSSDEVGAHAYGHNKDTIGACLIGMGKFTVKQFISLKRLYNGLHRLGINVTVKGHYEVMPDGYTKCPGIDMDLVRTFLSLDYAHCYEFIFTEMQDYIASYQAAN